MCVCVCWGAHLGAFGGCCGCLFSNLFIEVKMVFLDYHGLFVGQTNTKRASFRRPPVIVGWAFISCFLSMFLLYVRACYWG